MEIYEAREIARAVLRRHEAARPTDVMPDLHCAVAAEVYGVPLADVTPHQRSSVKHLLFDSLYGTGPQKLGDMKIGKRQ